MSDLFPEQKGGRAPIAWFLLTMTGLICGTTIFVSLATQTGIFESLWTVLTFIYEIIDELWEK